MAGPDHPPKTLAQPSAGGMGPRAQELFERRGIQTVIGAQGPVDEVARAFVAGELQVGESTCAHPDQEHGAECHHERR